MADEDGANRDRSAMTEPSNQPPPQARPASTNNESASTSIYSRVPSKSPQQSSLPLPESAAKAPLIESQPMTTSSSSSSLPAEQHVDTISASPYGTRSRNRTGNQRPNYAEDRELDMEYEWASSRKSQGNSVAAMPSSLPSGDGDKASAGSTRHSSTSAPNGLTSSNKAAVLSTQTNNIPGLSTFFAYSEPNVAPTTTAPTRKRKAPGSGPMSSHASTVAPQVSAVGISRRNGIPSQARRLRVTNLMTFDNCQGYLRNGKLKADDGTILAVNGESSFCGSALW